MQKVSALCCSSGTLVPGPTLEGISVSLFQETAGTEECEEQNGEGDNKVGGLTHEPAH